MKKLKITKESYGYIYFLSHPLIEGKLKIGYTTRSVKLRAKEIAKSMKISGFFKVEEIRKVINPREVERDFHNALEKAGYIRYNINGQTEFFEVSLSEAMSIFFDLINPIDKVEQLRKENDYLISQLNRLIKENESLLEKVNKNVNSYVTEDGEVVYL